MAEQEKNAVAEHVKILRQYIKDYDNLTIDRFSEFTDDDIRLIRAGIGSQIGNVEQYLPKSFVEKYGHSASAVFMREIQRVSHQRGLEDKFNESLLDAVYRTKANVPLHADLKFEPGSIKLADGTVAIGTPQEMLNRQIAQDISASNGANSVVSTIPKDAVRALVAANPGLLDSSLIDLGINLELGDEAAYDVGYASCAGLSQNIAPMNLTYPESAKAVLPKIEAQIFDKDKTDISVKNAFVAGWIAGDIDFGCKSEAAQASQALPRPSTSVQR
jgi:hypothetical protein